MKLTVFQSAEGDCLLLTGKDGKRILVDGGMPHSFKRHVAPALSKLNGNGGGIDLVYVSHIDEDHIGGVVELMDDMIDWRVYRYQTGRGRPWKQPGSPEPPQVARVWHNPFKETVSENAAEIEEMLATTASVLATASNPKLQQIAHQNEDLAQGVKQAIRLTHRLSGRQLNIPVNEEFDGKLIYVRDGKKPRTSIGGFDVRVLAPFEEQLEELRREWDTWLKKNKDALEELRDEMQRDVEHLTTGDEVELLKAVLAARAGELGDIGEVTPPNLASLMLMVSEGRNRDVLLTGDGHPDHILAGLKRHGLLKGRGAEKGIHVRVLKVPHHASENNITEEFCRRVTADHYVTCGNGSDTNPDVGAIGAIIDSRLSDKPGVRSKNAKADAPFKMWFNSSSKAATTKITKAQMAAVEKLVKKRAAESGGRMECEFLTSGSSFEFEI